jgi:hypothetical protein
VRPVQTDGSANPQRPLIGAIEPKWLEAWIAEHGPWIFHVTAARHADAIRRDGLMRWDARPGGTAFTGASTPRPGHVYFTTQASGCDSQWELSDIDPRVGAVACVDLRLIDPRRLVPDEDPWTLGVLDFPDNRWGLGQHIEKAIGDGRRWPTGGEWAEAVALGSQSGIVEWAFSEWGRVAVAGRVDPQAIRIAKCDEAGRWRAPAR